MPISFSAGYKKSAVKVYHTCLCIYGSVKALLFFGEGPNVFWREAQVACWRGAQGPMQLHRLKAGHADTLIMFFQMKFKFSKKFQTVHHPTQSFCFFFNWISCSSKKSLHPKSVTAAMVTLPKK